MRWYSYPAVMASNVSRYAADIITTIPGVACTTYVNVLTTAEGTADGVKYHSGHIVKLSIDAAGQVSTDIIDMAGLVAGFIGNFLPEPIQTIQELVPLVVSPIAPMMSPYVPLPALYPQIQSFLPHISPPAAGATNAQVTMVPPEIALSGWIPFCLPSVVFPGGGSAGWVINCIHYSAGRTYSFNGNTEHYQDPPINHSLECALPNSLQPISGIGSGHNGGGGIHFGGVPTGNGGSFTLPPETTAQGLFKMYSLNHQISIQADCPYGTTRYHCSQGTDERVWKPYYQELHMGWSTVWLEEHPDKSPGDFPSIGLGVEIEVYGYLLKNYNFPFYPIKPPEYGAGGNGIILPGLLMGGLIGGLTTQTTQTILANMLNMQSGGGRRDERRGR